MSTNIDQATTLRSTLRISKAKTKRAKRFLKDSGTSDMLTESMREMIQGLTFGEDGFAPIPKLPFFGEWSAHALADGTLARFVALTEGEAEVVFSWEGGNGHSGLRIRDGKMTEAEVVLALAPEESA